MNIENEIDVIIDLS